MQSIITYYLINNDLECIYYKSSKMSYATHTHANHITIGFVLNGAVCIACNGQKYLYHASDVFGIMPDIPHALEPINDKSYSMIALCIPADRISDKTEKEICYAKRLKQHILNAPENKFSIEDMAQSINISPYHMIRQFKSTCGLTPHQFQIQCRVRKAQKLLEAGKSVIEAAYVTGFCDQSHFDRCFRKIVRLTPIEYKRSVEQLA